MRDTKSVLDGEVGRDENSCEMEEMRFGSDLVRSDGIWNVMLTVLLLLLLSDPVETEEAAFCILSSKVVHISFVMIIESLSLSVLQNDERLIEMEFVWLNIAVLCFVFDK